MALTPDDLDALATGIGTVRVVRDDGSYVADGARAKLERKDRTFEPPTSRDQTEIVVRNEVGNEAKLIELGDVVERITDQGPVEVLVVSDEVEAYPGPTVETRGVNPPESPSS